MLPPGSQQWSTLKCPASVSAVKWSVTQPFKPLLPLPSVVVVFKSERLPLRGKKARHRDANSLESMKTTTERKGCVGAFKLARVGPSVRVLHFPLIVPWKYWQMFGARSSCRESGFSDGSTLRRVGMSSERHRKTFDFHNKAEGVFNAEKFASSHYASGFRFVRHPLLPLHRYRLTRLPLIPSVDQ